MSDPRLEWLRTEMDRHVGEVSDLVRFPTVASDPANAQVLMDAGRWLTDKLTAIGMENATVHPADGYPVVTAEWMHAPGQPTVLLYGHFDVQPARAELWDTPPFEPQIVDGTLTGRGVIDCKGALMMGVTAIEAMLAVDGTLPVNVKFFLEGQEELGSPTLLPWVAEHADWLGVDYAYSMDAMMLNDDQGLMWRGLKGAAVASFTLTGANRAVHSGIFGGTVPNAAVAAAEIVASLHHDDGSVAVEGFYDDVDEITDAERAEIALLPFDPDAIADDLGLDALVREAGYHPQLIRSLRPTLEVTGIDSGIHGPGAAVPNVAKVWITCRLVTSQDPAKIGESIERHVRGRLPAGITVECESRAVSPGIRYSDADPAFQIARQVLTDVFGQPPAIGYVGGGVPVLTYMRYHAGRDLVTFGFQREDENFHAPNEFMRLADFTFGQGAYIKLLEAHRDRPLRPAEPMLVLTDAGDVIPYEPESRSGGHQGF